MGGGDVPLLPPRPALRRGSSVSSRGSRLAPRRLPCLKSIGRRNTLTLLICMSDFRGAVDRSACCDSRSARRRAACLRSNSAPSNFLHLPRLWFVRIVAVRLISNSAVLRLFSNKANFCSLLCAFETIGADRHLRFGTEGTNGKQGRVCSRGQLLLHGAVCTHKRCHLNPTQRLSTRALRLAKTTALRPARPSSICQESCPMGLDSDR